MNYLFLLLTFIATPTFAQYEDYESYQTFSDLDSAQRDYGLVLMPSTMYTTISEQNSVPSASVTINSYDRNILFYDIKVGYVFRSGFYFGLLYAGESQDMNSSSPLTTRESVGAGFGYFYRGWSLVGHYFPYSKQEITGTTDVSEYTGGMGFQLDAAYYFRLGRFFSIGPQITYKSINYTDTESVVGNVGADADSSHTVITPMISLLFNLYRG